MSGSIFQAAAEISVGERDREVSVTFLRTGDLSRPVNLTYDVTAESATVGQDYTGTSGTTRFEIGQDQATIKFQILNDTLSEATETFVVSIAFIDSGTLSVPRTTRINILDDENPVLPPTDPPLVSPYRVDTETVVSGLEQPINFEFSPVDPDIIYVAQKDGLIRTFNIVTGDDLGTFIDLRGVVNNYQDRGLMDIAIHPNFPANPYIYAFYVVDPPAFAGGDGSGNRYSHVVRFTADASAGYLRVVPGSGVIIEGNAGRDERDISGNGLIEFSDPAYINNISSEQYLRPGDPSPPTVIGGFKQNYLRIDSLTHAGGSLAFGPDGMLYISTGDGATPTFTDPRAAHVQDLNSLAGKILRVDPITGRGLTDNPFYTAGQSLDSNISKVYQYGLRNPFSMGFDDTGRLFITDTGWNAYEEINNGPAGANFGWPWYEGREGGQIAQTSGYNTLPNAAAFYTGVANGSIHVTAPYAAFGHALSVPGFQSQAIVGGNVIYDGGRYPAEINDDYFFSNFPFGHAFTIDTYDRRDVTYLFSQEGSFAPVHYTQGPDGYVYFADLSGSIGTIFISDPAAPSVVVSATAYVKEGPGAQATATFTLSAVQSSDVVVTFSTKNGTATAGSDFTAITDATIVIRAGQLQASTQIAIGNDGSFEPIENLRVQLQGATSNGAMINAHGSALISIGDDDVAAPGTNLLVDGSFEQASVVYASANSFQSIPGWTAITGGALEVWHYNFLIAPSDGLKLVELDSGSAWDGAYQDVQTIAGQVYSLSFDLRQHRSAPTTTQNVEILWNGAVVGTTSPTSMTWSNFTIAGLVGTGGLDRLTIREAQSQSSDGQGALVDNFRLVPTGTNLLVNGSLEQPTVAAGNYATYTSIPGWTAISGGTIELWNAHRGVTARDGANFAELDYAGAWDGFYQDVRTSAGQAYSLTFDLRQRPDGAAGSQDVEIVWNGTVVGTTSPTSASWGSFTVSNLIGTGGLDRLTIRDVQSQSGDGLGALVDNFRLTASAAPQAIVTVAATPPSVAEAAGAAATVTFTLNAVQAADTIVTYSTVNGSALAGSDFASATNATATIRAGQLTTTAQIALINDSAAETSETFSVALVSAVSGGSPVTASGSAAITITDSDPVPPGINLLVNGSLEQPSLASGSFATFTSIPGWTAITGGLIELWNAHNGAIASSGVNLAQVDYAGAWDGFYQDVQTSAGQSYALTFDLRLCVPDFATSQAVEVLWNGTLVATTTPASTAWSSFTISNLIGTGGLDRLTIRDVQSQSGDGIGALVDNFSLVSGTAAQPVVTITATPGTVAEAAGANATITFALNAVQAADTIVTYSTTNGTALAGLDFTAATNATATIRAGQLSTTALIPILNDSMAEATETFSVTLVSSTSGGAPVTASGSTTVTITDTDAPPSGTNLLVNGSLEQPMVPAGGFAAYTSIPGWTAIAGGSIELWNANNGATATSGVNFAQVDYAGAWDGFYQDVQTSAGQAYSLTFDLRLCIPTSATSQAVEILWNGTVVGTTTPASTAWSSFTVSNLIGTGGLDRLTIRDVQSQSGDGIGALVDNFRLVGSGTPPPSVSIAATPASVAEATDANATVTFTLSAVQAVDTIVTYSTAGGSATANLDFVQATNATATIRAGQLSATAQIPILNDSLVESSEAFSVALVGATVGGSAITASGSTTVTITDSDSGTPGSNLLINPSLEQPILAAGSFAAYTSISGWTAIAGGSIELWNANNGATASAGVNFAQVDYAGAWDGFYQDVQTSAGQGYSLTFDLRLCIPTSTTSQAVEILWNGTVVGTTTPASTAWSSFTVSNLIGTGGLDRLTIRDVQSQSGDGIGALVDNFRLVSNGAPIGGADDFYFAAPPSSARSIAGFVTGTDRLIFSAAGFGGGLQSGVAPPFVSNANPAPASASGHFLYDTDNGALGWDSDGTGPNAAIPIATLGAVSLFVSDLDVFA